MCDGSEGNTCEKGIVKNPEECTPEQIKECHGDVDKHPCCGE